MLEPLAKDVWIESAPLSFFGIQLGTRMTVLRLASGEVVVHSPIRLDDALAAKIDAIGPVRHVLAPNSYHHLYAGPAKQRYPSATLYGSPKLAKKRSDLRFDRTLGDLDLGDELVALPVDGCMLGETDFFHAPSKTLLASDLIENFRGSDHAPTRAYLKLNAIWQKPGVSTLIKVLYRDKKAARKSLDRILELPFERISIAHGDPIVEDAKDVLRESYAWLRG
jgi:hypothetical protein